MAVYTSQNLIDTIKKKAFIPSTQETFTDADLLELATDEMRDYILPKIKQTREEYFVTYRDYAVSASVTSILAPDRAVGNAYRDIQNIEGSNSYKLARLDLEDNIYGSTTGALRGYYLEANKIMLRGNLTGTIRVYYMTRPGRLVLPASAAAVASITPGVSTTDIVVSTIPSTWSASETIDMVRATSGFSTLKTDIAATISGTTLTVANADVPDDLAVGDWMCLADESPVPQVPPEWYSYLAQAVASQVLESLGDWEALERSNMKMKEQEKNALSLITARVQSQSKKIVSPYNRGASNNEWWD
jgi:hypothetical protein